MIPGRSHSFATALAATVSCILLGATFVATRAAVEHTGAAGLGFLRYGLAVAVLLIFLPLLFRPRPRTSHVLWILFLGAIQFGLFILLLNAGLAETLASRGAVIFGFIPILTMLVAAIIGTDSLSWLKTLAAVLAIGGVILALGDGAFTGPGADNPTPLWLRYKGELLVFAGVCCGATYNAFSGRVLKLYSSYQLTLIAMTGGILITAPAAFSQNAFIPMPHYGAETWTLVLFIAIPGSALAYFLFNWAIQKSSPLQTAIFVPLSPISASFFAAWLLQEPITWQYLAGLAVVIASIFIAIAAAKRENTATSR